MAEALLKMRESSVEIIIMIISITKRAMRKGGKKWRIMTGAIIWL